MKFLIRQSQEAEARGAEAIGFRPQYGGSEPQNYLPHSVPMCVTVETTHEFHQMTHRRGMGVALGAKRHSNQNVDRPQIPFEKEILKIRAETNKIEWENNREKSKQMIVL